jgi:hypothetical protein
MTLIDLHDAIDGFYELENERNENYLEGVRIIAYYAARPHLGKKSGLKKIEDVLTLERDKKRRKAMNKDLPSVVMEVIYKNNDKQSNG